MTEYKFDNCTVRIHGSIDQEKLKAATEAYLKKVVRSRKYRAKEK